MRSSLARFDALVSTVMLYGRAGGQASGRRRFKAGFFLVRDFCEIQLKNYRRLHSRFEDAHLFPVPCPFHWKCNLAVDAVIQPWFIRSTVASIFVNLTWQDRFENEFPRHWGNNWAFHQMRVMRVVIHPSYWSVFRVERILQCYSIWWWKLSAPVVMLNWSADV